MDKIKLLTLILGTLVLITAAFLLATLALHRIFLNKPKTNAKQTQTFATNIPPRTPANSPATLPKFPVLITDKNIAPPKIIVKANTTLMFDNESGKNFQVQFTKSSFEMPKTLASKTTTAVKLTKKGIYILQSKTNPAQSLQVQVN